MVNQGSRAKALYGGIAGTLKIFGMGAIPAEFNLHIGTNSHPLPLYKRGSREQHYRL